MVVVWAAMGARDCAFARSGSSEGGDVIAGARGDGLAHSVAEPHPLAASTSATTGLVPVACGRAV